MARRAIVAAGFRRQLFDGEITVASLWHLNLAGGII